MNIIPLLHNTCIAGIHNPPVLITDKNTPIVIPFGPPACGKAWLIRRLFRYLWTQGYYVSLDNTFVPKKLSSRYIIEGERFLDSIGFRYHMPLLFRTISQYGSPLFQLLCQNSESYFDIDFIGSPVRLLEIMQSPNRKIWLFMLELNWHRMNDKDNYENRIIELSHSFGKTDEVIFVVPKIDLHHLLYNEYGKVVLKALWHQVNMQYSKLFVYFKTKNFFWRFLKPYTFDFCPFSSGRFSRGIDNREVFVSGEDVFPEYLWKLIKKRL